MGLVQFQIAPHSSLYFLISIVPFRCSRCHLQGFNLLHRSLLKRFPLFIWLLFAVSSVSNFRPDTGGQRRSLVQVLWFSPAAGRPGRCRQVSLCVGSTRRVPATLGPPLLTGVCAFPVYTAQAPGCSIWSGLCIARGSSFRIPHKNVDSAGPAFHAFAGWSSSGSQELDGCTLPGAARRLPFAVPASVSVCTGWVHAPCVYSWELASSRDPPGRCRPSRISGSLWLETGGLSALW